VLGLRGAKTVVGFARLADDVRVAAGADVGNIRKQARELW